MSTKTLKCIQTDSDCLDPLAGVLLPAFVLGELNSSEENRFEEHLETCAYCSAAVSNWPTLRAAIGEHSAGRRRALAHRA